MLLVEIAIEYMSFPSIFPVVFRSANFAFPSSFVLRGQTRLRFCVALTLNGATQIVGRIHNPAKVPVVGFLPDIARRNATIFVH